MSPYGALYTVARPVVAHDDAEHLWHGHALVTRGQLAHDQRGGKLEARTQTIGDETPTTREGWAALLARLAPGERVRVGGIVTTLTRSGYYCATGDDMPRQRARTADGLARKLSAA